MARMQREKALMAAVALALAMPAAYAKDGGPEPDSVIELYGKLYPEVVVPSGSGATGAGEQVATFAQKPAGSDQIIRRTEVESSNSRLGFRGHEKLGRDLKAIFQLET
ncbi:MAG TPA: hypothetical protein VFP36_02050, partial [Usitatibacter sp.]|nr:hypothetical protein [Usitatibacter sp.]